MQSIEAIETRLRSLQLPEHIIQKHVNRLRQLRHRSIKRRRRVIEVKTRWGMRLRTIWS